jgi:hypothetical protein
MKLSDEDNAGRCIATADMIARDDTGRTVGKVNRRCVLDKHETGDHTIEMLDGLQIQIPRSKRPRIANNPFSTGGGR